MRGDTHGDNISPSIFNIEVDASVWHWLALIIDNGSQANRFGPTIQEWLVLFYADKWTLRRQQSQVPDST
jgi:hypothetical protein